MRRTVRGERRALCGGAAGSSALCGGAGRSSALRGGAAGSCALRSGAVALAALLLAACPAPPWERESPLAPLPAPPLGVQADYARLPFAMTPGKVRLGRWLFFDRRLSAGGGVACADCHQPADAFSERTPVSTGIREQRGTRKAPSLVNVAWPIFEHYFRDGRAGSLIAQAAGPIENPIEMGSTTARSTAAIAAVPGYARAFRSVYGDDHIEFARIAEALSAYEATRMSGNSAFDRFDNGESGALAALQQQGRALFYGKAGCTQCHVGWNFSDARFHNLGVGYRAASGIVGFTDRGRAAFSGKPEETGAFKTPTLRDVSKHPPYMHDGSLATLRDVLAFYNRGGNPNPWRDPKLAPLSLGAGELAALEAFLRSLDGEGYADTAPAHFPN